MLQLLRLFICILLFSTPFTGKAFGVLTHEAVVDALWDKSIVPYLKLKFPAATPEQLKEAHAYAYGGSVAPDMGYYPRGSKFFTDLIHYVRSGDMVKALFDSAHTLNQYAFAVGFLSHYNADYYGHPLGTNRSVGLVYPSLEEKYGQQITYAQDKIAHVRMEFGFDVLEIAKGNYASQSYRDFIGFKVDTTVLSKAFTATYGLDINEVFDHHFSRAVETFRWVVANIFPVITRAAWAQKKSFILENDSTATSKQFHFKMRNRNFNKTYGRHYKRPGIFSTVVSFFIRALPKIGPLKALKFKAPTKEAEVYFVQSFDSSTRHFATDLKNESAGFMQLKNIDYDTGLPTATCEYSLANDTYNDLVMTLQKSNFASLTPALQQNIINFYGTSASANATSKYCRKLAIAKETMFKKVLSF